MSYIGVKPKTAYDSVRKDRFTSTTGTTVTLSHAVSSVNDILVWVNGVKQDYTNYSVSSTTLTLGGTLVSSDVVEVAYLGRTYGSVVPNDGSVGTSALQDDAVTAAKLSSTAVDNTNINSTLITAQTEKTTLVDADKFLISDSAASGALKYVQKSNLPSGIYNQVANVTISDGDSIEEVQSIFTSTYRNYMILFERIAVNTNSADLELKFIKSDGSVPSEHTYQAEGSFYNDTGNFWGESNGSKVTLMQGQGQGAGKHVSGYMHCFDMNSTTDGVQRFTWFISARKHDSNNGAVYGAGGIATNAARTGIKLTVNSGTLYGGRIVVYGITNPS